MQLDAVEKKIQSNDERKKLRRVLTALNPSKGGDPIHAARVVCRTIIPDSVLQYFTVQRQSKSNTEKRILPQAYPNIFTTLLGTIIRKLDVDYDKAVSALITIKR